MLLRSLLPCISLISSASAFPWWLGPADPFGGGGFEKGLVRGGEVELERPVFSEGEDYYRFGVEFADVPVEPPSKERPDWFFRFQYGTPSKNTLSEIFSGTVSLIDGNESYCFTLGRYLKRDAFGLPLDISLNGTICYHPANSNQDDIFQYIVWLQFQWTEFPWNEHLRTRIGLGEGLSYYDHIPYSEMVRREFRESTNLLNYLEFSISLNMEDLLNLTRLSLLLPNDDASAFSNSWLVGSLNHRSGGKGLFGTYEDENGDEKDVTGGDNIFAIGMSVEF